MHELLPVDDSHIDAICDLINRTYAADKVPMVMSRAEVVDLLNGPHITPTDDARVIQVGGRVVGYEVVLFRPSGERQEDTFLLGAVDTDHRRKGIGSALLQWGISRSRERFSEIDNELPRIVRAEAYPWQEDRIALLTAHGLEPARYYHDMIRPLKTLPVFAADGFAVERWAPRHNAEARLVFNQSFRDHWGSTPADEQVWEQWLGQQTARLDLSFVATADGKIIGVSLNEHYPEDEAVHGRREGCIGALGTLREYRNMGVATALIIASCQAFAAQGLTHAALGVDTDSPTGANKLYTNLGFVVDRQSILLQKQLEHSN